MLPNPAGKIQKGCEKIRLRGESEKLEVDPLRI